MDEYWIVDWRAQTVEIYRLQGDALVPTGTLGRDDTLTSPVNQPSQPASPAGVHTTDTLGGSSVAERAPAAGTRARHAAEATTSRAA